MNSGFNEWFLHWVFGSFIFSQPVLPGIQTQMMSISDVVRCLLRRAKTLFRRCLLQLPYDVTYVLTLLTFWPTVALSLCYSWLFPRQHRRWDRITDSIILGAVPLWHADILHLRRAERVTGIINCCREWNGHTSLYHREGIEQLHLPTLDFFAPTLEDCRRAIAFINARAARGESVFVHCKAGKGRSTTIVLCFLVVSAKMRCVRI